MLGKLLKYDFKAFLRVMLPFYLALMALSLLAGFSQIGTMRAFNKDSPLTAIWGIALGVVLTVNIIMVIQRFRDNLLKNEGYLMFTLPVTRRQLLVSKALTAFVSLIISGLVLILSGLLFGAVYDLPGLLEDISESLQQTAVQNYVFLLRVLAALIMTFQQICLVYALLLGSQILPRFRVPAALGAYILVMYVEVQIILALTPHLDIPTLGAIAAVFAGLFFWLCGWLLHHTLNLE